MLEVYLKVILNMAIRTILMPIPCISTVYRLVYYSPTHNSFASVRNFLTLRCCNIVHSNMAEVSTFARMTSPHLMYNCTCTGWSKKVSHYQIIKKLC